MSYFQQFIEIFRKKSTGSLDLHLVKIETDLDEQALYATPDPSKWCRSGWIQIRIHNTDENSFFLQKEGHVYGSVPYIKDGPRISISKLVFWGSAAQNAAFFKIFDLRIFLNYLNLFESNCSFHLNQWHKGGKGFFVDVLFDLTFFPLFF